MEYKGYIGSIEFSEEDMVFFGQVQGIGALISYEGNDAEKLVDDFHEAIDCYLMQCEENGIVPEKTYKGSFNVRISPELHKAAAIYAMNNQRTLNNFIEECIKSHLMLMKVNI